MRTISFIDKVINEVDTALRTISPPRHRTTPRHSPAAALAEPMLSADQKKHSAGLMRVNHAGEVCAQALYQGQALTAQLTHIKKQMTEAAIEETDHLAWCEQRLYELGSTPSQLNLIWYCGSILLGALAGLAGDKISLGFVAETEQQVCAHLQEHLQKLPVEDKKTKIILEQMQEDEEHHAHMALEAGGIELPFLVKQLMTLASKLMTKSSYYI
ncbi:2-polyprenyl-3-methyl-6-methoxy-1,4-benzoquinone monooxygenase [Legionella sp. km772]|uniref:2-polyprenyl-3-methyl-6-methoxy-1,4-benzoquinone monooxygenase n=1 Tax=Legionella sp. km772 TaxID=2498111 RepID=UPI000F8F465C|nr:2-polyprenyl-3-methyl-6-methoxy-1,4-benzoquinone monooxygenase [Legionella sp. km772]RUR12710.1 2-polyprenyl-3-methyl-6-methoxy-1,4-benzoquinone monooxygenase [Legionella sp. km772]